MTHACGGCVSFDRERTYTLYATYTPGQNVWSGSKSAVTFGLIKILTHPC